jgi:hypothetical protein
MTRKRLSNCLGLAMLALLMLALFDSCEKTIVKNYPTITEDNPFDGIDYGDGVIDDLELDSSSFLGLHTYILEPSCAQPACHDGNFEPDFRTVQSSYNTLVYHSTVKNDADNSFDYRVDPGSRSTSWLWERVTTGDSVLGRMPLYDTLSGNEVEAIGKWIDDGAQDIFGISPLEPNFRPNLFGWLAYNTDTFGYRYDTVRADEVAPMILPDNTNIQFWFGAYDVDPNTGYLLPAYDLTYNKVRISDHPFELNPTLLDLEVEGIMDAHWGPLFFDATASMPYFHHIDINTGDYERGRVYYVRVYIKDADHSTPTEIPDDNFPFYLISLMTFMIE